MLEFYGNYDIATPDPYIYIYVKNEIENSNTKLSDLNDCSSIYTTYFNDFNETYTYLFKKGVSQINDDSTYFITTIKPSDNQIDYVFVYLFNKDSTHLHITYLNLFTPNYNIYSNAWFSACSSKYNVEYADCSNFDIPFTLNTDTKVAYISLSISTSTPTPESTSTPTPQQNIFNVFSTGDYNPTLKIYNDCTTDIFILCTVKPISCEDNNDDIFRKHYKYNIDTSLLDNGNKLGLEPWWDTKYDDFSNSYIIAQEGINYDCTEINDIGDFMTNRTTNGLIISNSYIAMKDSYLFAYGLPVIYNLRNYPNPDESRIGEFNEWNPDSLQSNSSIYINDFNVTEMIGSYYWNYISQINFNEGNIVDMDPIKKCFGSYGHYHNPLVGKYSIIQNNINPDLNNNSKPMEFAVFDSERMTIIKRLGTKIPKFDYLHNTVVYQK